MNDKIKKIKHHYNQWKLYVTNTRKKILSIIYYHYPQNYIVTSKFIPDCQSYEQNIKVLFGKLSSILIFPKEWFDSLSLENGALVECTLAEDKIIITKNHDGGAQK